MSGKTTAAVKLVGLAALGVAVFLLDSPYVLAGALISVLALGRAGGVKLRELWRQTRVALLPVSAVVVAHGFTTSWAHGGVMALRLSTVIVAATAVALTTPVTDLLAVIESALAPLRPLGVDPTRVGLVLAMALRFVPLIGDRLRAVREAQRARGLERPGPSVAAPLLVGTLRLADDLADALDARGLADGPD